MRTLLLFIFICLGGCRASSTYPLIGSVVGGGGGALGGPATGALGAGLGYSLGTSLKEGDIEADVAKIRALTEGDVTELMELKLKEEGGFMDQLQEWVWGILKFCFIGSVLYLVVPILYTRYIHKKIK